MKIIVADTYSLYINSKKAQFPVEFKNHKIIWNMRQALLEIWTGNVEEVVIPKEGTPGYDFVEFIEDMITIGQIKDIPEVKYYDLKIST
jgi:hypothetical protein